MSGQAAGNTAAEAPWLLVIDPQVIFADSASEWASPEFDTAMDVIERVAPAFGDRVLVTRWLPTADRTTRTGVPTSWAAYFAQWTFADVPADDPLYRLVPRARALTDRPTLDVPTFGKWGADLQAITGEAPHLVLTGVSTDCCVVSTALAAADAGAHVEVLADGCAGSTPEDGAAALRVMGLYAPQITVRTSADLR